MKNLTLATIVFFAMVQSSCNPAPLPIDYQLRKCKVENAKLRHQLATERLDRAKEDLKNQEVIFKQKEMLKIIELLNDKKE